MEQLLNGWLAAFAFSICGAGTHIYHAKCKPESGSAESLSW